MKNKLKLNPDGLHIQSFETERPGAGEGTVRAHEWSDIDQGCLRTYYTGCLTCPVPCTVDATCRPERCGL